MDDALKFFYIVSHLRWYMHAHMLTYYNICWPLIAFTSKTLFYPCI